MCIAAIGIGLSLAGSAMGMIGQQKAYSYQSRISARNRELAGRAAVSQYGAVDDQLYEGAMKSGQEQLRVSQDSTMAQGRIAAAAAEAGVSGRSVQDLHNDFKRQEGEFISASQQNYAFMQSQAVRQKEAIRLGYESRLINAAPPQRPNLFGDALGAFSSAFDTGLRLDRTAASYGGRTLFLG